MEKMEKSSNSKNAKKRRVHMTAITSAVARGRFFMSAYTRDGMTARAETPEEARAYFADHLPMYHDGDMTVSFLSAACAVRFLYWLEKRAMIESLELAHRGHEKTGDLDRILQKVIGKKGSDGEQYVYHISDESRTAQLVMAYQRHGNNDGGDLFDTVMDTVQRFVYIYEDIYASDTRRPVTDILSVETARDENGNAITGTYTPAPGYIPFHMLWEANPDYRPDRPETRMNTRVRSVYRAIYRDLERAHRAIFFTSAATSLDAPIDADDADGDMALGDVIPDTPATTPDEKVDAGTAAAAARKVCAILGRTDAELSAMLSRLTTMDEYGHLISADPAIWENFTRRARIILDSPTPELARLLHAMNITETNHTMRTAYTVISLLRREAWRNGDRITYARLSATAEEIQKKREVEKKNSGDPEALREALSLLRHAPQAPTPAAILRRLSPAQKRTLSAARRENARSRTEFFTGDYRRAALLDALRHATATADRTLAAVLDALHVTEEKPTGKAAELYDPRAILIPEEHRPTYYIPLSPRAAQIYRRMKRAEKETADRLHSLSPEEITPAAITAAVIASERGRYGEEPDAEVSEALILYAAQSIYRLRYGRSYGGLIWEPTEKELLTALRHATAAAEVVA